MLDILTLIIATTPYILTLIMASIMLYLALTERATYRRNGGIHFLRIAGLRIQFSVAKRSPREIASAKRNAKAYRIELESERTYWAAKGRAAFLRKHDLRNATLEARMDSQLALIDWTPDDWSISSSN